VAKRSDDTALAGPTRGISQSGVAAAALQKRLPCGTKEVPAAFLSYS